MNGYVANSFRTRFGDTLAEVRRKTALACDPKLGMTDKTHMKDCDMNEIWRRFGLGQTDLKPIQVPFLEVTEMFNFQDAQNVLVQGKEAFMQLPSKVRDRFGNDPVKFMDYCREGASDEGVALEMVRMGLAVKVPKVEEAVNAGAEGKTT